MLLGCGYLDRKCVSGTEHVRAKYDALSVGCEADRVVLDGVDVLGFAAGDDDAHAALQPRARGADWEVEDGDVLGHAMAGMRIDPGARRASRWRPGTREG